MTSAGRVYIVTSREHAEALFPRAPEHVLVRVERHTRDHGAVVLSTRTALGMLAFDLHVTENGSEITRVQK